LKSFLCDIARPIYFFLLRLYVWLFARAQLRLFNQALFKLSLRGLGYNNCCRPETTGELWFIRTVLRASDVRVCLDVGAHVGAYSRLLVQNLDCRVYALEPTADSFAELQKFSSEHPQQVFPIKVAAGDVDGSATIHYDSPKSPWATMDASLLREIFKVEANHAERVSLITLDTLVSQLGLDRVDFIKVDTEGFEREVFKGMQRVLRDYRPRFVQFEFNRHHLWRGCSLLDLSRLLQGYSLYRLLPNGWVAIAPGDPVDNVYGYSNVVAVRQA
jgi:FkbM family methyltransferase